MVGQPIRRGRPGRSNTKVKRWVGEADLGVRRSRYLEMSDAAGADTGETSCRARARVCVCTCARVLQERSDIGVVAAEGTAG